MRDIPLFTTENGAASLALKEIPYKKEAYITIQSTLEAELLLRECVDFCKAAGAEKIYATGHAFLESYPVYTTIWTMCCQLDALPQTDAALFPVQARTLDKWRSIYNERMRAVPVSSTMTLQDAGKLLESGSGYFVHRGDTLLGIGKASGQTVEVVISTYPGAGKDVVSSLCSALSDDRVLLEVASENKPAVELYQRLGFIKTGQVRSWYQVF